MLNVKRKFSRLLVALSAVSFGVASGMASADLTIPQVPLQTGNDVPSNIMFLIDDSGSMNFEFMPDALHYAYEAPEVRDCVRFRANGECRDWGDYYRSGEHVTNRWYYSSHVNKAYFNPSTKYDPPSVGNGTSDTLVAPTYISAWQDGFSQTNARNLSNNFRVGYHRLNNTFSSIVESGTLSFDRGAFYYNYQPSEADKDSCAADDKQNKCYVYVSVNNQTAAEKQRFANWYSFYRSRLLLSRSGIGTAFNTLEDDVRVGYGALNTTNKIVRGVRGFSGTDRSNFFNWLYGKTASGGTPLRLTLKAAGDYFKTDEPYRINPAIDGNELVSCRQNFSILMTDGAWNGGTPSVGDSDGDGTSDTLADVAHYYWKTDLHPLKNDVPKPKEGQPDWQHMVTFGVGLGVDGKLTPEQVKGWKINDIRWVDPTVDPDSTLKKIDDLMHASINSDGGFFSAKDPTTFSNQLIEALNAIMGRAASASNLAATTTSLLEDNSVFQASFNSGTWSGELVSRDVATLAVQWSANFPAWGDRNIYTSRDNEAFAFNWNNLNASEQTALKSEDIVNYLKGDSSKEKTLDRPAGVFRERKTLLGDIAHSSPVYVGAPQNRNYQRHSWSGASSYAAYISAGSSRAPTVYVGANDGMLHGFNADATSVTKGQETFAYIPQQLLTGDAKLASLSDLNYQHKFFVDGSPTVQDVYINGSWRSVLVSTLGRGGNSVFALDVTDPEDVKLLWDLTIPQVGVMLAKPVITRLNNDTWSAVLPYGYNNGTGKNGILIIDIENGATVAPITLETPDTSAGMGQLEGYDRNGNGNTDWMFAGDLNGNIWKFDLSAGSADFWAVANGGEPLFTAKDKAGKAQPVTGGVTLTTHPETGQLWVFFGTGKFLESGDSVNSDTQSWYGLMDGSQIGSRAQLVERVMSNVDYTNPDSAEVREGRSVPVAAVNDLAGKRGWVMDLIDTRERITSKPRLVGTNLVMNTIIPDSDLCNPQGDGWIMAVDPFAGSRLNYNFFDLSRDRKFQEKDELPGGIAASGVKFQGMPGEPLFVGDEMLSGSSNVGLNKDPANLQIRRGRLSWREVINQ
ncbi:pilus assembly protein PilY [Rheinheimera sp. YQF-2]|uniref:Pilus assembly protein PilY n=1 Tax=Rheinheimera lutimaris TaxID=2740584 RepID=A0A7Y5EHH1_9GAMM|nr:PilC/PilY family type IV pilus protein [Rheinheimera lutimaris]NRQ41236.1 pilus assembly protein PilY [Rheinheimera lutimaris]